ncbi:MAG: YggS family pyridoxal phosphate-dependent enzyme [Acidimicrobiales bacterium]
MSGSHLDSVLERAEALRALIAAHATRPTTVVAVTKRFGAEAVVAAMAAGIDDIGENYAQELAVKASSPLLADSAPRWHFIGHLQRNKVRQVAGLVSLWETIDSRKLGTEIAKRAPGASVLVQVNTSGAETQSGIDMDGVHGVVDELRGLDLDVRGLMTIGSIGDSEMSRKNFSDLRSVADDLELPDCSMGMSQDLVPALEEGSTIIRVGTLLFGPRP